MAHQTQTPRGVNDPHEQGPGPLWPPDTGVVHALLSVHRLGALTAGRRMAPSDRAGQPSSNPLCPRALTMVLGAMACRELARLRLARALTTGTGSLPALVPLSEGIQRVAREERDVLIPERRGGEMRWR